MTFEITYQKLEEVADVIDSLHKTPKYAEFGIPMVRCVDLNYGVLNLDNTRKVSDDVFREYSKKYTPSKGDIIITRVGAYFGDTSYVSETEFCLGQNTAAIIPKNNKRYVYYFLNSNHGRHQMQMAVAGAAQPTLSLKAIRNLEVPRLGEQLENRIADIVGSLDDKIETNHQINQTLEQIAQAIFKSWFVDFEPVKAKIAAREALLATYATKTPTATAEQIAEAPSSQEIEKVERQAAIKAISGAGDGDVVPTEQLQTLADLFPNQLVESELGEIPEGWEVKGFGDVSSCFDSKRVPLSKNKREEKKPGNIPYYGATSVMDFVNEWIFDGVYLLLGEDGSVVKDDGSPFVQYIWGKSWVNNHAHVLQGTAGVSTEQLMLFIQSQNIASYVTGAVQLKLNQKNMNSIPFVDAGKELNEIFYQVIAPLYSSIRNNTDENEVLSQTRDILLPKLLSGEINLTTNQKEVVNG